MISKAILGILLLTETSHIFATNNNDKNIQTMNSNEFHNIQTQHFQNSKNFQDPALQFQKDYDHEEDKAYKKHKTNQFMKSSDVLKFNEIDSNELVDKYNKNGHIWNPDLIKIQKYKTYQEKRVLDKEKQLSKYDQASLLHDMCVNYVNNNKEVSGDSELITEKKENKNKERYRENYQNGNEIYMKRFKKDFFQGINKIDLTNPPPPNDTILMARYIVHTVDWAALATLSTRTSSKGAPFVCVKATSDGMKNESSGIPFFYMSPMDLCAQDLQKDNKASVLVTLSETEYCKNQNLDPQDPRCAKLTLSGKIKKIKPGSEEEKFAKNALFSRHPAMKSWPADHNWYFTKLKIGQIILLDQFGGATYIKIKDYLKGKIVKPEL